MPMKIVYPPTEKTLQKIEAIRSLREIGTPVRKIADTLGVHTSYVHALENWDRENRKEDREKL